MSGSVSVCVCVSMMMRPRPVQRLLMRLRQSLPDIAGASDRGRGFGSLTPTGHTHTHTHTLIALVVHVSGSDGEGHFNHTCSGLPPISIFLTELIYRPCPSQQAISRPIVGHFSRPRRPLEAALNSVGVEQLSSVRISARQLSADHEQNLYVLYPASSTHTHTHTCKQWQL